MLGTRLLKRYSIIEKLGMGTTSSVYKVLEINSSKEFSCKHIKRRKSTAMREINVLRKLPNDSRFPQYKETIEEEDAINIVMSHSEGIELFEWFVDIFDLGEKLSEECVKNIFIQMVNIIRILHDCNLCHLDIKLENFIISTDSKNTISIIDFGATHSLFKNKTILSKMVGTVGYSPYETYNGSYYPTSDSWSLGVCLWTLLTNTKPFPDVSRKGRDVIESDFYFPTLTHIKMKHLMTPQAFDLINKLLIITPEERLCPDGILKHKWLSSRENLVSLNTINT
jgi:serine/threonine protein kinase